MADQLATTADLAAALQINISDLNSTTATLLLETATAVVQEATGGQRLVQVVGDVMPIMGTTDSWLPLPQLPVTAVTAVTLDGTALTVGTGTNQYQVFGNRLWRSQGWQTQYGYPYWDSFGQGEPWWSFAPPNFAWPAQQPSLAVVTCTHGYAAGAQQLQLARSAVLSLASSAYSNPSGVSSESIDDYSVSFANPNSGGGPATMSLSPYLKAALRRQYGRRAGLVRLG